MNWTVKLGETMSHSKKTLPRQKKQVKKISFKTKNVIANGPVLVANGWSHAPANLQLRGLRVLWCSLFRDVDPKKASYWEGGNRKNVARPSSIDGKLITDQIGVCGQILTTEYQIYL